jgi:hypothetical protein
MDILRLLVEGIADGTTLAAAGETGLGHCQDLLCGSPYLSFRRA